MAPRPAAHRTGTAIRYSISGSDVAGLYGRLLDVAAARSADVDVAARRYLSPDYTEHIGREELLRRVSGGDAMVLDVRPALKFGAGHIPGATSIPLAQLVERLDALPADQEIVAYCRGAYCTFSHDAVRLLNSRGRRAVRLADGIVEWQAAGEPLTATAQLTGGRN